MACDVTAVLMTLQEKALETNDRDVLAATLVASLRGSLAKASWVGIYWLEGDELVLGPFDGPDTPHKRIPVGKGVCGTAVAEKRDQIIEDVRTLDNYLACSPDTRSEIVVLIRSMGEIVGQIDADSDEVDAFDDVDHCILRTVADSFGGLIQEMSDDDWRQSPTL